MGSQSVKNFRFNPGSSAASLALALLLCVDSADAAQAVLDQVLYTEQGEAACVTLNVSTATPYTSGYLKNPRRFYIDLQDTQPRALKLPRVQPGPDSPIQSIRVGRFTKTTTRFVLDLRDDSSLQITATSKLAAAPANGPAVISVRPEPALPPPPPIAIEQKENAPNIPNLTAAALGGITPLSPLPSSYLRYASLLERFPAGTPQALPPSPAAPATEELLMSVRVNGQELSEDITVFRSLGEYWLPVELFRESRLQIPVGPGMLISGTRYLPLNGISGARSEVDPDSQTLNITVPPQAFARTDEDGAQLIATRPTLPAPGLFLNHEFQTTTTAGATHSSVLLEGGLFSKFGVLTHQVLASNLQTGIHPIRLNTQFVRDFAGHMTTLTVGDTTSGNAAWSRPVFFAGVRYARNFETQPGFIPSILPTMSGQAAVQSTVDVYVDNVRQLSLPVDRGPFTIRNIPVISSQGDLRMVVTDMLGRQQVITDSYIRSTQMLRPGVQEFSYEAGTFRTDYGRKSFAYRSIFAAGTHRIGVTNNLTLEAHQEFQPGVATTGLGAVVSIRQLGILSGGIAGSFQRNQSGRSFYAGFSRSQRAWGISTRIQRSTQAFRQIGYLSSQKPASLLWQSNVSRALGNHLSISLGYLRRDGRSELDARAITASISVRTHHGTLSIGGLYSLLQHNQYGASISFTLPWGERNITTTSGDVSAQSRTASVEASRQLGQGPGIGYRVKNTTLDQQRVEASLSAQNAFGTYQVDAAQTPGQLSVRLSERGAVSLVNGHLMASRWLNDSFAVVQVEGARNVPVYVNNQMLAKTDRRGLAMVPWLVPYNRNQVHIDDNQLPLDRSYDLSDQQVVPMRRAGMLIKFQPASQSGAILVLTGPLGTPLPFGTKISILGDHNDYMVAMRGEVFVNNLHYPVTVQASGPNLLCSLIISRPPSAEPLPTIGPLSCVDASR
jgi:outer membrane usher protein